MQTKVLIFTALILLSDASFIDEMNSFLHKKPSPSKPNNEECYYVKEGNFWPTSQVWPHNKIIYHGFNHQYVLSSLVMLQPNTAQYIFAPNFENGTLCETSWNKLFGTTRCGYLDLVHEDSDRFVWRRDQSCLIYNGSYVKGQVEDCPQANQIELAAYTYDDGNIPYKNATLLKQFKNTVEVGVWYNYTLYIQDNQTIFALAYENGTLIETQVTPHRNCSNQNEGNLLAFYFGGECKAPQDVTACYTLDLDPLP